MVKKIVAFTLLILSPIISYADNIDKLFPTLRFQIQQIKDKDIDKGKAFSQFRKLLTSQNKNLIKYSRILLQEQIFKPYLALSKQQLTVDENSSGWDNIPDLKKDKQGDVTISSADLISFRAYLDKDYKLYSLHKTKTRPLQKKNEEAFLIWVYFPKLKGVYMQFVIGWNGKHNFYNYTINGKKTKRDKLPLIYKVGRDCKAIIPLGKIMKRHNIPLSNKIIVRGGMYHPRIKKRHDFGQRMDLYSRQSNYALELLLYLLNKFPHVKDDNILFALALANNYIYSIGNAATRKEIKKDLLKHYQFYKKVIRWQKGLDIHYRLETVPLIPKILWANRARYFETEKGVLTLKYYKEFIERIENLEKSHRLIQQYPLRRISSLSSLTRELEKITSDHSRYRSSLKNLTDFKVKNLNEIKKEARVDRYVYHCNKKRDWDKVHWLNYQWQLHDKRGFFRGDCGTYTTMHMSFYRAAGIPPLSLQYSTPNIAKYTHNFAAYYNPFLHKWDSVQKPSFRDGAIYFYFKKPKWHHRVMDLSFKRIKKILHYGYYQGEKTRTKKIVQLLTRGITDRHFATLFFSHRTMERGLFFNQTTATLIKDSDGDGISDEWEKLINSNPRSADSDKDGYSDLWELEHNSDFKTPTTSTMASLPILDGIVKNELRLKNMQTGYSPQGDYKATKKFKDIKSISAMIFQDRLYLGATFYNDISKEKSEVNSIGILAQGIRGAKKYWIQWSNQHAHVYQLRKFNNWKNLIKLGSKGLDINKAKDMEFSIPLSYFPKATRLNIIYHTSGFKNGKKKIIADSSKPLLLNIRGQSWKSIVKKSIKNITLLKDIKGDALGIKSKFDIKSFGATMNKDKLIIYSDFHNDISHNSFGYHTIHIHSPSSKLSWWLQFWNTGEAKLYKKSNSSKWKKHPLDLNKINMIMEKDFIAFILSKRMFHNAGNLEISYNSSAIKKDGALTTISDRSPKYLLKHK